MNPRKNSSNCENHTWKSDEDKPKHSVPRCGFGPSCRWSERLSLSEVGIAKIPNVADGNRTSDKDHSPTEAHGEMPMSRPQRQQTAKTAEIRTPLNLFSSICPYAMTEKTKTPSNSHGASRKKYTLLPK